MIRIHDRKTVALNIWHRVLSVAKTRGARPRVRFEDTTWLRGLSEAITPSLRSTLFRWHTKEDKA